MNDKEEKQLLKRTQKYIQEGKYKTGLTLLLQKFDQNPGNEFIYNLMSILVKNAMKGSRIELASLEEENLLNEDLDDPRLDPIYDECSICESVWVNVSYFLEFQTLTVNNLVGGKCSKCGKLFCRKHMDSVRVGPSSTSSNCPECGGMIVINRDKPKGRTNSKRIKAEGFPIIYVLIYREGPLTPDREYVNQLLKEFAPDVLSSIGETSSLEAFGLSKSRWEEVNFEASSHIFHSNQNYLNEYFYLIRNFDGELDGDRFYLVIVYDKELKVRKENLLALNFNEKLKLIDSLVIDVQSTIKWRELITIVFDLFILGNFSLAGYAMKKAFGIGPKELKGTSVPIEFEQAIQKMNNFHGILQVAYQDFESGYFDIAVSKLEAMIKNEPYWALLHSDLGYFLAEMNEFQKAKKHLSMAIRLDPFLKEAKNNLGMYHVFLGNSDLAKKYFEEALEIDPNYPEARQNLKDVILKLR